MPTCRYSLCPQLEKVPKDFQLGGENDGYFQIAVAILLGFLSYENHFPLICNHYIAILIITLLSRLTKQSRLQLPSSSYPRSTTGYFIDSSSGSLSIPKACAAMPLQRSSQSPRLNKPHAPRRCAARSRRRWLFPNSRRGIIRFFVGRKLFSYHRQSFFYVVFSSDLSSYLPAGEKIGRVLCGKSCRIGHRPGSNGGIVRGAKEIGQVEKGIIYFEFTVF